MPRTNLHTWSSRRIIFIVLPAKGRTEHKYPALYPNTYPCSSQEIEKSGFRGRSHFSGENYLSNVTCPSTFKRKCGSEGSFSSHPHQHPMQFNTVLDRNLNLVILKNEISVTRAELLSVGTAEEILDPMRPWALSSAISSSTLVSVRQCPLARGHWVPRTCSLCLDLGRLRASTQSCAKQAGLPGLPSLARSLSTVPVHPTFPCFSFVILSHPQPVNLHPSLLCVPRTLPTHTLTPTPIPRNPSFLWPLPSTLQACKQVTHRHTQTHTP